MGTVTGLLVVGGLGFGVVAQLLAWLRGRALRAGPARIRLDLHAQVVLVVSGGLLLVGTVFIAWLEWNSALAGQPPGMKLSQAFFQSATCRTAGFNSLDLTLMTPASLFLMIVLMFIGGAPGSTAGGVKVTAVAIVWANLRSIGQRPEPGAAGPARTGPGPRPAVHAGAFGGTGAGGRRSVRPAGHRGAGLFWKPPSRYFRPWGRWGFPWA